MVIKKIMFENEVLEVGKINEKYNPTAVKGIEGIRPLWTLWISLIILFVVYSIIMKLMRYNGISF